jgi:hypothetical protein
MDFIVGNLRYRGIKSLDEFNFLNRIKSTLLHGLIMQSRINFVISTKRSAWRDLAYSEIPRLRLLRSG